MEKPDAIREERDVKTDNKATVWNNAGLAESSANEWIAEKSCVIKDERELCFVAKLAFKEFAMENEMRDYNHAGHCKDAANDTLREEGNGIF